MIINHNWNEAVWRLCWPTASFIFSQLKVHISGNGLSLNKVDNDYVEMGEFFLYSVEWKKKKMKSLHSHWQLHILKMALTYIFLKFAHTHTHKHTHTRTQYAIYWLTTMRFYSHLSGVSSFHVCISNRWIIEWNEFSYSCWRLCFIRREFAFCRSPLAIRP